MSMRTPSGGAGPPLQISAEQRDRLQSSTLSGIKRVLAAATALHKLAAEGLERKSADLLVVAAGLYTYAFEEYGKLLLVADLEEADGAVTIPYRDIFRSHSQKFKRAARDVPREFQILRKNPLQLEELDQVIGAGSLGPTFPERMLLFYADIDSSGNPTHPPMPDPDLLERAMDYLGLAVTRWEERNGDALSNLQAWP